MQCPVCKKMKTPLDFEYWSKPNCFTLLNTINPQDPRPAPDPVSNRSYGPVRALDQA